MLLNYCWQKWIGTALPHEVVLRDCYTNKLILPQLSLSPSFFLPDLFLLVDDYFGGFIIMMMMMIEKDLQPILLLLCLLVSWHEIYNIFKS